jgi:DNA-binding MarR family transcriptional regulator
MSPALAAHIRILQTIPPERLRTHVRDFDRLERKTGSPGPKVTEVRRAAIARMLDEVNPATGKPWTQRQIADELGISRVAVQKNLRVLDGGSYNKRGRRA